LLAIFAQCPEASSGLLRFKHFQKHRAAPRSFSESAKPVSVLHHARGGD
jgi:hypothetical protein